MNNFILKNNVQQFINDNLDKKIEKIIFAGSPFQQVSIQELADQISSKNKCKDKLPTWFNLPLIYYPKKINIEQTSSEITANYKSKLISGKALLDVTGGFGVDSYYFSKQLENITYCEIDKNLAEIVQYNYKKLGIKNIEVITIDGLKYLTTKNKKFDCIYIDPSRRNSIKGKVFLLEDCMPNIPKNIDLFFSKSNNILIKASPILDLTSIVNKLKYVKEIHVIAVKNEVKELLILLNKNYNKAINIKAINILKDTSQLFTSSLKNQNNATFSMPKTYLYEPNSAIFKTGLFNELSHQLKVDKLHNNSHLYTSSKLIEFPGRRFKITEILPFDNKVLKKFIPSKKANITTRNFTLSVAQIRKKTGLKDGGDKYLFFTTNYNNKHIVIVCEKI